MGKSLCGVGFWMCVFFGSAFDSVNLLIPSIGLLIGMVIMAIGAIRESGGELWN